jgi:hypothetical protein
LRGAPHLPPGFPDSVASSPVKALLGNIEVDWGGEPGSGLVGQCRPGPYKANSEVMEEEVARSGSI